jgi:hypothetical protein
MTPALKMQRARRKDIMTAWQWRSGEREEIVDFEESKKWAVLKK